MSARWVASQEWHPKQMGEFDKDGSYCLSLPYADDRELVMDILKYGPGVEVLEPAALRERVAGQLSAAAKLYRQVNRGQSPISHGGSLAARRLAR